MKVQIISGNGVCLNIGDIARNAIEQIPSHFKVFLRREKAYLVLVSSSSELTQDDLIRSMQTNCNGHKFRYVDCAQIQPTGGNGNSEYLVLATDMASPVDPMAMARETIADYPLLKR